jgi:heme/copper-type cytochrome/quinol oxidase subunit 4
MDLRYYKTNMYFLGFLTIILGVIIFFLLRQYRAERFQQNLVISIIMAIITVCIIYYFPLKLQRSIEPFDE